MASDYGHMISITVKCPAALNPDTVDYTLRVRLCDTVRDLKDALHRFHPCEPEPTDQRLIFRGQMLDDALTIESLCGKETANSLVVHMVIKSGTYHRTGNTLEKQSHPPSSPPVENPRVDMAVQTEVQQSSSSLRPEQITPSGYYGFMNDQGQVIYTDISNAVLFDGRQFYVMRGANLSQGQRLPFSMSQASLTIPRLPTPIPAQPPPRLRDFWNRIHFDVTAFLTFMVRLALVVLIFSQGGDKWRVVTVCAVLGIIFFIQAGVVPINIAEHVNRFWEALMRPRRVIQPPQEQAVPAEGVGHGEEAPLRQDLPRQEFQQNPLVKLMEIFTTFILSLFPQEPPRAQRLE